MMLTCTRCGWVHFAVTRAHAEAEVTQFNDYFEKLPEEDRLALYGGQPSSISSYERCFRCGAPHTEARPFEEGDLAAGRYTLQPMIQEDE